MTTLPSFDTQCLVASEAAQGFVDDYYQSINKRQPLGQYYVSASKHLTSASVKPDISINGRVVESVAEYEAMLDAQGINVHYDVQSFDAHPVNANYAIGCPENLSTATSSASGSDGPGRGKLNRSVRDGSRVSFAIQVSGAVRYGKPSEAPAAGTAAVAATAATTSAAAATAATGAAAPAPATAAAATAAVKGADATKAAPVEIPAVTSTPLEKPFTESWLLVPHWEALGRNAPRGLKKWLVVSQNFRAL